MLKLDFNMFFVSTIIIQEFKLIKLYYFIIYFFFFY